MISKIVEMDEKARELNDEALKSKIDYEQEIAVAKQTIIKDYLERARKRVQINAQSERDAAKKELAQTREAPAKITRKEPCNNNAGRCRHNCRSINTTTANAASTPHKQQNQTV